MAMRFRRTWNPTKSFNLSEQELLQLVGPITGTLATYKDSWSVKAFLEAKTKQRIDPILGSIRDNVLDCPHGPRQLPALLKLEFVDETLYLFTGDFFAVVNNENGATFVSKYPAPLEERRDQKRDIECPDTTTVCGCQAHHKKGRTSTKALGESVRFAYMQSQLSH